MSLYISKLSTGFDSFLDKILGKGERLLRKLFPFLKAGTPHLRPVDVENLMEARFDEFVRAKLLYKDYHYLPNCVRVRMNHADLAVHASHRDLLRENLAHDLHMHIEAVHPHARTVSIEGLKKDEKFILVLSEDKEVACGSVEFDFDLVLSKRPEGVS
jgi:hypothetical protein